jgi:hypothetical protein
MPLRSIRRWACSHSLCLNSPQLINKIITAFLLMALVIVGITHVLLEPNRLKLVSAILITYGLLFTSLLQIAKILNRMRFNRATQAGIPLLSLSQKLALLILLALIAFTVAIFCSEKSSLFFITT